MITAIPEPLHMGLLVVGAVTLFCALVALGLSFSTANHTRAGQVLFGFAFAVLLTFALGVAAPLAIGIN